MGKKRGGRESTVDSFSVDGTKRKMGIVCIETEYV